jgi:hypothetical protein
MTALPPCPRCQYKTAMQPTPEQWPRKRVRVICKHYLCDCYGPWKDNEQQATRAFLAQYKREDNHET